MFNLLFKKTSSSGKTLKIETNVDLTLQDILISMEWQKALHLTS